MSANQLVFPTVHLNGSGYENLSRQYSEGLEAVQAAIDKLPVPHGRDYYVQPDGAFERARIQYNEQLQQLNAVRKELELTMKDLRQQLRGDR